MTSPTEQRRAFDVAINRYKAGDTAGALGAFRRITADNPAMTDAWMGRLACGDRDLDALAGAHLNSRALYRETRRIGQPDGALQGMVNAPLYLTLPVWSRATIGLGYASALILASRYDDALAVLNDPTVTADTQASQLRQFVAAALYHRTHRWADVATVTAVCPPADATYVTAEVSAATVALKASAAASLGRDPAGARPAGHRHHHQRLRRRRHRPDQGVVSARARRGRGGHRGVSVRPGQR